LHVSYVERAGQLNAERGGHGTEFEISGFEISKGDTLKPGGPILGMRRVALEIRQAAQYILAMLRRAKPLSLEELRVVLHPFCKRHPIRRLEIFGSSARGQAQAESDVDMLVTFDESKPVSSGDLLEMAGEAEELIGSPVDFVVRSSLDKSPNHFAREHILASAVCIYGS